ncbi:hypothetical protein [Methanococcoides sp. AM1]|uniref:hypothetical protein n=1 Tax=Methanococcoides sp. AM1 TaxID=1201011 RepID=UPI001082EE24|nr:hypothetical protein [Methanococcoides sp. AM1]
MVENGYKITEDQIVTRVAEGAIAFATGAQYAPVIEGTSTSQIKAATDSAATVVGFVKKPTGKDSIEDGDACDVVLSGLIKVPAAAAVTINSFLEVDATVTKVAAFDPDTTTAITLLADLRKNVGVAKSSVGAAGDIWIQVGRR